MKGFRIQDDDPDFPDLEGLERLVSKADRGLWQTMVVVVLNTGLRLGELMALRWEDVDLVKGQLRVRRSQWKGEPVSPKSGKGREAPLNSRTLAELKGYRHLGGEFVFC